ncbi:MAG: hypothetical protein Q9N34_03830 [Aquificota bacterium]|nr:hypothetical protein [Aquificota bacterium]
MAWCCDTGEITLTTTEAIGAREGITTAQVRKNSPGGQGRSQGGDIIVALNGKKLDSVRDLQLTVMKTKARNRGSP